MEDDEGGNTGSGSHGMGGSYRPSSWSLLCRAMRWETFALAAVLVLLAFLFA